jgi:O-acetyl-ADP-ribose deacetylase (regulator of RNase III)
VRRFLLFQAFSSISTGVYGYPIESATRVALGEVRKFLDAEEAKEASVVFVGIPTTRLVSLIGAPVPRTVQFERVIFVVFSAEDEAVYL